MKKVMEAIKDLIDIGNFEFSSTGFMLTDMDPNRFSVMEFFLHSAGFDHYHCDRNLSFAMNLHNLAKILNCAADDDILTIQAQGDGLAADSITFTLESPSKNLANTVSYFVGFYFWIFFFFGGFWGLGTEKSNLFLFFFLFL